MYKERLVELKNARNLTNQQISDISGVPFSTVTRIMNGSGEGNFQTVCDIVKALDGSLDDLVGIRKEVEVTEETPLQADPLIELYKNMLNQKDKWIKTLFIALAFVIAVFLFILMYDILNGSIGYVRY